MNKAQIKQLNKKVDKLLRFKKILTTEELGIHIELVKKYDLTTTKNLK